MRHDVWICFKIIGWNGECVVQERLWVGNCWIWMEVTWGLITPSPHFCLCLEFFHNKKKLGFEDSYSGLKLSEGLAVLGSVPDADKTKLTRHESLIKSSLVILTQWVERHQGSLFTKTVPGPPPRKGAGLRWGPRINTHPLPSSSDSEEGALGSHPGKLYSELWPWMIYGEVHLGLPRWR